MRSITLLFVGAGVCVAVALTARPAAAAFPGPNGKLLVANGVAISVVNADGTTTDLAVPPIDRVYEFPAWSADGSQIAFDDGKTIYVMNADGSNIRSLGDILGASRPAWSPDGRRIAFEVLIGGTPAKIDVINADGTGRHSVVGTAQEAEVIVTSGPSWSPDGSTIAFSAGQVGAAADYWGIALIASDGTNLRWATQAGEIDHNWYDDMPEWSPDGTSIVFSRWYPMPLGHRDVFRINVSTGVERDLTPQHDAFFAHPTWSPSGTSILAVDWDLGGLWIMNAVDGSALQLLPSSGDFDMPAWQPLNTPLGASTVSLRDANTGTVRASLALTGVTVAGESTLTISASGPAAPAGFSFGNPPTYFYIATTAVYATATLCIGDPGIDASSSLFHYDASGNPTNVTAAGYPDAANHVICSMPLTSLSPFAIGNGSANDMTAPHTTSSLSPTPNAAGWNRGAVTVSLAATDPDGPADVAEIRYVATGSQTIAPTIVPGAAAAVTIGAEGLTTVSFYARDVAGNTEFVQSLGVSLDGTPPLVDYSGNAGSYAVNQTVAIACAATDPPNGNGTPGSGLVSDTCKAINGPAYSFKGGAHTFSASATDAAGNVGSGATTFTVTVTCGSLCSLTRTFVERSTAFGALTPAERTRRDEALAKLCEHLDNARRSLTRREQAVFVQLYQLGVTALAAQGWLTRDQAAILLDLSKTL